MIDTVKAYFRQHKSGNNTFFILTAAFQKALFSLLCFSLDFFRTLSVHNTCHTCKGKKNSGFYLVYLNLIGDLRQTRKYFACTPAAIIMVRRNRAVPSGNRRPSRGCCQTFALTHMLTPTTMQSVNVTLYYFMALYTSHTGDLSHLAYP